MTESAHMKDVLSFARIVANPQDTLSWNRILLQLDKVGPKTAQKITSTIAGNEDPFTALTNYPAGPAWKKGIKKLGELFSRLIKEGTSPGSLFELIMQYYEPLFLQIYRDDYPKRQKDLEQLKGIMASYDDLQSFLDDTTLDPPETESGDIHAGDKVIISTIHSAKGLEWDYVFVIGLADGRFPHSAAIIGDQWEEERRLFYVAATRAKKELYLCYPKEMMSSDRSFKRVGMSPFLRELKPGVYQSVEDSIGSTYRSRGFNSGLAPAQKAGKRLKLSMDDFQVGCKVVHPFFGAGAVKKLSKPRTLHIQFDRHGLKTLHLDYAKLKIIST